MKENRVLTIDNLTTTFESHKQKIQAVRGVSLHVDEGDILAIVGESGSGKSVTMKSVMGLLGENADVQANHLELLKKGNWDVYVSAFVSAPTGDPEYFFTTHCLQDSSKNRGGYYSETLEKLEQQLSGEFDTEKRTELAIEMTQTLLDDHMLFFASHLKMSMVSGEGVTGLTAHPCDYYEITVNLDKNK